MKKREQLVDIAKGIAILAIIDVHLQSGRVFFIGESYHVSMFFLVAGLLLRYSTNSQTIREYIVSKFSRLMLPYFMFSVIYLFFNTAVMLVRDYNRIKPDAIHILFETISLRGIGTLWFLPVMFVSTVVFYLFLKSKRRFWWVWILIILVLSLFTSWLLVNKGIIYKNMVVSSLKTYILGVVIPFILENGIALGWLLFGYFYKKCVDILKTNKKIHIVINSFIVLFAFILCSVIYRFGSYTSDLHFAYITNPLKYCIYNLSGCVMVLSFASLLQYITLVGCFLEYFGRNSLTIMLTHKEYYICYAVFYVLNSFLHGYILSVCSLICIIVIEIIIVHIVNKTKLHKYLKLSN